jgi:hypothetical protein
LTKNNEEENTEDSTSANVEHQGEHPLPEVVVGGSVFFRVGEVEHDIHEE